MKPTMRVNDLPGGSLVEVAAAGSGRLVDLGLSAGSKLAVVFSVPRGPALVRTEDGRYVVLDSLAASALQVVPLSVPRGGRRWRWRRGNPTQPAPQSKRRGGKAGVVGSSALEISSAQEGYRSSTHPDNHRPQGAFIETPCAG